MTTHLDPNAGAPTVTLDGVRFHLHASLESVPYHDGTGDWPARPSWFRGFDDRTANPRSAVLTPAVFARTDWDGSSFEPVTLNGVAYDVTLEAEWSLGRHRWERVWRKVWRSGLTTVPATDAARARVTAMSEGLADHLNESPSVVESLLSDALDALAERTGETYRRHRDAAAEWKAARDAVSRLEPAQLLTGEPLPGPA